MRHPYILNILVNAKLSSIISAPYEDSLTIWLLLIFLLRHRHKAQSVVLSCTDLLNFK